MNINDQVNSIAQSIITDIKAEAEAQVVSLVQKYVADQLSRVNMSAMFESAFKQVLQNQTFEFPPESIPGSAIDFKSFTVSGDNITGGIVKNFGSTGIDDQATICQLSIFDETTVIENNLLTKDLTVKGTVTVEGDLNITGTVPDSSPFYVAIVNNVTNNVKSGLNKDFFSNFTDAVFAQIREDGLDLNKITQNGQPVVDGSYLGSSIRFSKLQTVGTLDQLEVAGESLLAGSLYVTKGRIGVNTIEPANALSVWDQEIEIGFGKVGNNTGFIGTPRSQTLVIGSNGKNNLTLTPDGGVATNQLQVGSISITASSAPPTTDSPQGTIVLNSTPTLGGPLGWVSLGNARWGNFGLVD